MSCDDIECVRRGQFLVIKNTNVAVHETEDKILGLIVQIKDEWLVVVPPIPTKEMVFASQQYCYDLPISYDDREKKLKEEIEKEKKDKQNVHAYLQEIHEEISVIQCKLYDLEELKSKIEKMQATLQ